MISGVREINSLNIRSKIWLRYLRTSSASTESAQTLRNPAGICMLKVNNRNTRTRCQICLKLTIKTGTRFEICSKLTIKTPKRRRWRRSGVFIANSEHVIVGLELYTCHPWSLVKTHGFWVGHHNIDLSTSL